ncbi:hypothetical protein KEM54_003300, partial [Ascosphaera aggregata]
MLSLCLLALALFSKPAHAFGAGNIASISSVSGQKWRHGDIEDTLLTLALARCVGEKRFTQLDVLRVYFGNWLRDYSQAVDVATLKHVSAEAIRILLWMVGFMTFGYGTREFEVTAERLGTYQAAEHIDNPLGYAQGEDARDYDPRLRGPVDEEVELAIDQRTGLKKYIAAEDADIETSAGLLRKVLGSCIKLGRAYAKTGNKTELYEAFRLLGTGLHCLEDYAAHSNYIELALIEMGESEIFPMVGSNVMVQIEGVNNPVYPVVTGTFGGTDFMHSVMGELNDQTTQSELQSLQSVIQQSESDPPSETVLGKLFDRLPGNIFGSSEEDKRKVNEFQQQAQQAQEEDDVNDFASLEPEKWAEFLVKAQERIYPILEWHDLFNQRIDMIIEKIPVVPKLIRKLKEQTTLLVFTAIAPFVLPIINRVKAELQTGSTEIIERSKEQQLNIFADDDCSNPTHSMLSKDHFSNVLNEPAGNVAKAVVTWTVPQIMDCWDDEEIDVEMTLDRIIHAVLHHPALRTSGFDVSASEIRETMFQVVERWWNEQGEEGQEKLRRQLCRDGIENGLNHRSDIADSGHGCGRPFILPQAAREDDEDAEEEDEEHNWYEMGAEAQENDELHHRSVEERHADEM